MFENQKLNHEASHSLVLLQNFRWILTRRLPILEMGRTLKVYNFYYNNNLNHALVTTVGYLKF
jgi:hypothetical protein